MVTVGTIVTIQDQYNYVFLFYQNNVMITIKCRFFSSACNVQSSGLLRPVLSTVRHRACLAQVITVGSGAHVQDR